MLRYRLHQLQLRKGMFILLPKLIPSQIDSLRQRLIGLGFAVTGDPRLTARRLRQTIHVNPAGFCWSSQDPTDAIVPLFPDLLAGPKQTVQLGVLKGSYFRAEPTQSGVDVRFSPRVDGGSLWTELRAAGDCGLAPDEASVVRAILSSASGKCRLLTDFPVEGSRVRLIGRRQYYESVLNTSEAAPTLRVVGRRAERNSYLPRNGAVHLESPNLPSRAEWVELFESLGEWCYLRTK